MKKVFYIFVAILSFLIGVFSYYIFFFFTPISVYGVKEIVPLYKLQQYPQGYISNKIVLQEDIVAFRDKDYNLSYYILGYKEKCGVIYDYYEEQLPNRITFINVNFINRVAKNEVQLIEELGERNGEQWVNEVEGGQFGAKVEITGYFRITDFRASCYTNTIDIVDIKQISPIRFISDEEMNMPK